MSQHRNRSTLAKVCTVRVVVSAALLLMVGAAPVWTQNQTLEPATETPAMTSVVHALCGKRVALLGESPVHGFGETLKFKAELVRRLVDECHFDALFIESGTYDYINIGRKLRSGEDVSDSMISAAIGGLWANEETQSLVPFLKQKESMGGLFLGGLDDQLGRGTYAQQAMSSDLVQSLPDPERSRCLAVLQKHMSWQYTEDAPYNPSDKAKILGCLDEIANSVAQPGEKKNIANEENVAMIDSLKRNFARDFTEDDFTKNDQALKWFNDRDKSMYLNFQWLLSKLPRHSKVIVWAATVHVAKNLSGVDEFNGRVTLGSYIQREFKSRAFTLGFSAYSGGYAFVHQPVRPLSEASASSIEAKVFAHRDTEAVYVSRKQLHRYGTAATRSLGTSFTTARWDRIVDGLIIFRKERAPNWLNP